MATDTQDLELDSTPQSLETELGLADGKDYLAENISEAVILFRAAVDAPSAGATGHILAPYESIVVQVRAGIQSWFWTRDEANGALIILTEIA